MSWTRRECLRLAAVVGASTCLPALAAEEAKSPEIPVSGEEIATLAPLDDWMRTFMAASGIPGGQLAVAREGKLLYSRGFGYADRDTKRPVEVDSLFRIASVSKPITAVAILQLIERGKLKLSDKVDEILAIEPHWEADAQVDERWSEITIEHCLAHTGGWDRDKSYDPMFAYQRVAKSLGVKLPVGTAEIIRYMRGQPLDTAPGEHYAYSNFGFCLLGRVIEKLGTKPYDAYVREEIFAPLGCASPRMGKSLEAECTAPEVRYYTFNDAQATPMVGPDAGDEEKKVPVPYGGWHQEALDAHGGWIASASDLALFAAALDGKAKLISAESVQEMFAPHATINPETRIHYGLGWVLGREGSDDRPLKAHGGALPCTAASLVKSHDGLNLAVLFNLGMDKNGFLGRGLDGKLIAAARKVEKWPDRA